MVRHITDYLGRGFTPLPIAGVLSADYYRVDSSYTCYRPNGTRDWLIIFTLSGSGVIRDQDEEFSCTRGSFAVLPKGVPHVYYTAEHAEWEKLWCHFHPKPEWTHLYQLPFQPGAPLILHIENERILQRIESAFRRVVAYTQDTLNPYWEDLSINALNEVLYLVAYANLGISHPLDYRVDAVLQYLSSHYMEEIRIDALAKLACLSSSRLSHLFKQQVGESIVDILVKIRLKKSEFLLKFTPRTVTEIALEVGFNSLDYYTRRFSDFFGMTPSEYRKEILSAPDAGPPHDRRSG